MSGDDEQGRYLDAIRFFGADEKPELLSADVRQAIDGADPEARLARHFERFAALPWPSQMMRFDAETYLPEDVLTKVDRMSMAHSIESRVPLLDNEVIAFAAALPAAMKIKNGRRKHVLKEGRGHARAARDPRPEEAGFRRAARHLVPRQPARLFADTLLSPASLQRGYFQPAFVRRIVDEHLAGTRDHTLRLWQLVVFEKWQQQYVNSFPLSAPSLPSTAVAQSF